MTAPVPRRDLLRGIVLIILSSSLFGTLDGISKLLADTQTVGQIVWARYALGLPLLLLVTRPSNWISIFHTSYPTLQIVRGATPLFVSIGMVLGVRYLPLAEATVILFAAPFLIVALSWPMLGERVRMEGWVGVTVGFAAVLLVARPGASELSHFAVFPLFAAVFFALYQLMTRRLSSLGERPVTTLAWTLLVGAIASTPFAIANWAPLTPTDWMLMFALGAVFGSAQLLLAAAFSAAPAGALAPFNYQQIIAAAVFGVLVFGDVPDVWTMTGILMIIAAGVYVWKRGSARNGSSSAPP